MYLMEHPGEGLRMENRNLDEVAQHLALAGLCTGDRVLDAGCASGLLTRLIASRVSPGEAIGIDISAERIAMARARADELDASGVFFQQGDIYDLPFSPATFDLSFCRYTFEYLENHARALAELKRVTRPGGRVVVADLDGNGLFHYPLPSSFEAVLNRLFKSLAKAGFDPFVGRKLYNLFYQTGLHGIQVHAMPHHLIAGPAQPEDIENWETKLRTIRPIALKSFPSETDYDAFVEQSIELLNRPDVLSYSITFLVTGVV